MKSFLEQVNNTMNITMFRNRLPTLKDPLRTLKNVREGNVTELTHLPLVKNLTALSRRNSSRNHF